MPLIHDNEYQGELNKITRNAIADGKGYWWRGVSTTSVILFITLFTLASYKTSEGMMVATMISVACICLVASICSAARLIYSSIVLNMATVEWVGRKQLGEYEAPENISE